MKGFIFNTPFYTKTDWHTGRLILSRDGQTKGYGEPGTMKFNRRVTFGEAGHEAAGITGTTNFRGKKVGNNVVAVADNPLSHESFGGAQARLEARDRKIKATGMRLQRLIPLVSEGRALGVNRPYSPSDYRRAPSNLNGPNSIYHGANDENGFYPEF